MLDQPDSSIDGRLGLRILIRRFHPKQLHDLLGWPADRPTLLNRAIWVAGRESSFSLLPRLSASGLAIVGTRYPHHPSRELLECSVQFLKDSELIIVSGLARGIDTAAHRCALRYGIPTVAVVGCGLHRDYPPENRTLKCEILAAGGLVLSEYPHEQSAQPGHFLERNRLIASFSRATWVVEAPARSGALNTAKWTRLLDQTCFATPCFPGEQAFAGNQSLLDQDQALPFWSVESLRAAWLSASWCVTRAPARYKGL